MQMMHRYFMRACAIAAAGVALGTWAATAASASGGSSATRHPGTIDRAGVFAGHGGAPRLTNNDHAIGTINTPANSRFFAGYDASVTVGSATTVETSFAVPTLSCTTSDRAIAPNAGVEVNSDKSFSASFVFVGCVSGAAVYYPGVVVNGTETDYSSSPVAAGDVVDLTTKVSNFRTRVEVTDVTTGVTEKITNGAGASVDYPYLGDEGWGSSTGQLERVPDFGKLQFKTCLIDGKAIGDWHPQAFQRVLSDGVVQIATGALWSTEPAFTTRYLHR
jgi:hypothetical protein